MLRQVKVLGFLLGLTVAATFASPMQSAEAATNALDPLNGLSLVANLQAQEMQGTIQSVYYDEANGDYWAAGMNYQPDPTAPDVWVTRFGPKGRVMKTITLVNCGHGSIGFIQGMVNSRPGYMTLVVSWRNAYPAGTDSLVLINFNKSRGLVHRSQGTRVKNFSQLDDIMVGGGTGPSVTVSVGDRYGWYTRRQLLRGQPPKRSLTIKSYLGIKQGAASDPGYLYIYTGGQTTSTMLYAYSWRTSRQVAAVDLDNPPYNIGKDSTGGYIGGQSEHEPEGMSIFTDAEGEPHLVLGFRVGPVHHPTECQTLVYASGITQT